MLENKAIFFDRDGVLNNSLTQNGLPYPPSSLSELTLTPAIEKTCDSLRKQGFLLFMMTNQPDIARGKVTASSVNEINNHLKSTLKLDAIYCCPHDDSDQCLCRKPLPGMILDAQKAHNINLANSFVIGDRWKDIEAGKNAGCKTIFIDYHYNEKKIPADYIITSAAEIITLFGD